MKPFVKWAGGKRQILKRINEFISDSIEKDCEYVYIEPFLGGGAVFFDRAPKQAIINDLNSDLINAYKIIQSDQYLDLIELLKFHEQKYKEDPDGYYYDIRALDRQPNWPEEYTEVQRAARMIFLNRTCYNGLYRVNSHGQFNTPIGRYSNPLICDESNIIAVHNYFANSNNHIEIMNESYEGAIRKAKDGDIIYIDPPYDYEDDDGFTKYQLDGFTFDDFKNLKFECDKAIDKGAFVIISNNATTKVLNLFEQDPHYKIFYDINQFPTLRTINCKSGERKTGREVVFWGMSNNIPFPQANDMEKIIRLVLADESILEDKTEAMRVIDVTTERQVAYYLSALLFLGYITHNKKFTDKATLLKSNPLLLKQDIYNQLRANNIFDKQYQKYVNIRKVDIDELKLDIAKSHPPISESTISRRASTIRAWVEWMYEFENKKINETGSYKILKEVRNNS